MSDAQSTGLFPVALNVAGRRCVIVGGGPVGERKARALVEAGANVVVVALALTAAGLAEDVRAGHVCHVAAPFTPEHLEGAFLAIAATDRPEVNAAVAHAARARGVLVNLAAPPAENDARDDFGDFATMASVRRGDLLIAVSTGGAGPALAARLKRDLGERFGPEWADFVALLGEMRVCARQILPDEAARTSALRRLAASDAVRLALARGDVDGARRLARELLGARL
jgi:siroheme synthase-like protein